MNVYDVYLDGTQESKLQGVVKDIVASSEDEARKIALAKDPKYGVSWNYRAYVYKDVLVTKIAARSAPVLYNTDFYRKFYRERKQFTLGDLIDKLEMLDPATLVKMQFSDPAVDFTSHSYRGYYDQLAIYPRFDRCGTPVCVSQLVRMLKECDGHTYSGWKGGDYTMDRGTPIWVSDLGETSNTSLVGLNLDTMVTPPVVTLLTSMED